MKLYKFRSLQENDLDNTLDILANERLYCALHSTLNDPFEGLFEVINWSGGVARSPVRPVSYSPSRSPCGGSSSRKLSTLSDIPGLNDDYRVCSLSAEFTDIRMWSHYASGHAGLAIEVDIEASPEVRQVRYLDSLNTIDSTVARIATAEDVLSCKTYHWGYEKEFRILQKEQFFDVKGRISSIILGVRFDRASYLGIIRERAPAGVPIHGTRLDHSQIRVLKSELLD